MCEKMCEIWMVRSERTGKKERWEEREIYIFEKKNSVFQ